MLSAANAAEVLDQLVRVFGRDADDVHADLALLANAGMEITPVTADQGLLAGRLRARHYHRERCAVSLGDCLAAAAALTAKPPLATSDSALAAVVRAESAVTSTRSRTATASSPEPRHHLGRDDPGSLMPHALKL